MAWMAEVKLSPACGLGVVDAAHDGVRSKPGPDAAAVWDLAQYGRLLQLRLRWASLATPSLHKSADKGASGGLTGISPRPDQPVCYSMDTICSSGATSNPKVARSRLARPTRSEALVMLRSSASPCSVPTIASHNVPSNPVLSLSASDSDLRDASRLVSEVFTCRNTTTCDSEQPQATQCRRSLSRRGRPVATGILHACKRRHSRSKASARRGNVSARGRAADARMMMGCSTGSSLVGSHSGSNPSQPDDLWMVAYPRDPLIRLFGNEPGVDVLRPPRGGAFASQRRSRPLPARSGTSVLAVTLKSSRVMGDPDGAAEGNASGVLDDRCRSAFRSPQGRRAGQPGVDRKAGAADRRALCGQFSAVTSGGRGIGQSIDLD